MRRLWVCLLLLAVAACESSAPAPEEPWAPEPEPAGIEPVDEPGTPLEPIGTVSVQASVLNVRTGPSTTEEVIETARRGSRLALLAEHGAWSRVRLADGREGWAASRYLRRIRNCPPDRDYGFRRQPALTHRDDPPYPPGLVTVEATVGVDGKVTSTEVISNTTGDTLLGQLVEHEISTALFDPPIENCRPRPFIFVYRRTF